MVVVVFVCGGCFCCFIVWCLWLCCLAFGVVLYEVFGSCGRGSVYFVTGLMVGEAMIILW